MYVKAWDSFERGGYIEAFVIILTAALVVKYALNMIFDPLRSIPGPWSTRFTRLWELHALRKGDFPSAHLELHRRYGSIVRLAPNRYSISDPTAFKTIYSHGSKFYKSRFYHAFGDPNESHGNLFSEQDPVLHAQTRRSVSNMYSMTTLLSYERFVDDCTALLCRKLTAFSKEGRSIDIPTWMQYYAFDVIGSISVGKAFGLMESECDPNNVLSSIRRAIVYSSRIGLFPELHYWIARLSSFFGGDAPIQAMVAFVQAQIDARKSGSSKGRGDDFLAKSLALEDDGKIDRHTLLSTLVANIGAGSDTTAIGFSAIIYLLLRHPDTLVVLREELASARLHGRLSDPATFQEAQKLPYLQACVKEAMRLHPATGQIMARVVPEGGAVLSGHFFPAGTVVGSSPWVTHFNPDIYGSDAAEFRPERWLQDKSHTKEMELNLFTFGAGAHTCIGKNISIMEVTKVIPQILSKFDFELCTPEKEWELDPQWFVYQAFPCKVHTRSEGEK